MNGLKNASGSRFACHAAHIFRPGNAARTSRDPPLNMSTSGSKQTETVSALDTRAQIIANAMLLFPHLVQAHHNRHGYAAVDGNKVFDVVYCVRPGGGTAETTDADITANAMDIRKAPNCCACLIYRDPETPVLCRILIKTGLERMSKHLLEQLLVMAVAALREGTQALPLFSSGERRALSNVWEYYQDSGEIANGEEMVRVLRRDRAETVGDERRRARGGSMAWLRGVTLLARHAGATASKWVTSHRSRAQDRGEFAGSEGEGLMSEVARD